MEELRIGVYGLLLANLAVAFLFATFPLVTGLVTGNRKHALLGFILTIAGGGLLGLFLAFPVAMLFVWLILKRFTQIQPNIDGPSPDLPSEVESNEFNN